MEENIKKIDLQTVSMQTLAFIGDAVYNVYIRTYLASISNKTTGKLHKDSIKYVSAKGQSKIMDEIFENLTEEEIAAYKRGRNTNISKVTKNVDIVEYKRATGFEAMIGYLYIKGDINRLDYIVGLCIKVFSKEV
ncbi:MAG: ribonuclease III domain-containing protein [Clostridia bacterium]